MIDPVKIKNVLSKASDQQLISMLKKPDMIPSMFVQQEIARRNRMRQESKAQLQTLSQKMKPTIPVPLSQNEITPRGQNVNPVTEGGITYMKPGGQVAKSNTPPPFSGQDTVQKLVQFAKESGGAIGKLDKNKQGNLYEWLKRAKKNPTVGKLREVNQVLDWMSKGRIVAPQAPDIREFAIEILNANNFDPDYRGFVAEEVFPLAKNVAKALSKIPNLVDNVVFGEEGIVGFSKELKKVVNEQEKGNVYSNDNPAPLNPVSDDTSSDSAYNDRLQKVIDLSTQNTGTQQQNFESLNEQLLKTAGLSPVDDPSEKFNFGQDTQGIRQILAAQKAQQFKNDEKIDQPRPTFQTFSKPSIFDSSNDVTQSINQATIDEANRLAENRENYRVNQAPRPDQESESFLDRTKKQLNDGEKVINKNVNNAISQISDNVITETGPVVQKVKGGINDLVGRIKDFDDRRRANMQERYRTNQEPNKIENALTTGVGTLRDLLPFERKNGELVATKKAENALGQFDPRKAQNPIDYRGQEFLISPEENDPSVGGISSLDKRVNRVRENTNRNMEEFYKKRQAEDRANVSQARQNLNRSLSTNFGDTNRIPDPLNPTDSSKVGMFSSDVDRFEKDARDSRNGIIKTRMRMPDEGDNPRLKRIGAIIANTSDGMRPIIRDPSVQLIPSQMTEDARRALGREYERNQAPSVGQNFSGAEETMFSKFDTRNPITGLESNTGTTGKDTAKKFVNDVVDKGFGAVEDIMNNRKAENRENYRSSQFEKDVTKDNTTPNATNIDALSNNFTTKINPNADTYKDTKRFDNLVINKNNNQKIALKGDPSLKPVLETPEGQKVASDFNSITNAQNKLIEAMKPAGEANNRFWGLVANFGARLTANDWQDALNQTMSEFTDMKASDKANFVEMAKLGYGFETDKMNYALKLRQIASSAQNSRNTLGLGRLRIQQDNLDTKVRGLGIIYKGINDSLKELEKNRLIDPDGFDEKASPLLKQRDDIMKQLQRLNSGSSLVYSPDTGLTDNS